MNVYGTGAVLDVSHRIIIFLTVKPAELAEIVILPARTRGLGPRKERDYGY